ncbi:hypothetical protein ACGFZG_14930 [Streptomyces antibioticus]|uniref:hypothetical protein n=1 Tax=Streptomyces antibioticus TaxID=1890 RepID=UPI0037000690
MTEVIVMPDRPDWPGWGPTDQPPPSFDEAPGEPVSEERRTIVLDWTVNEYVARGWRLESRSPTQAIMTQGDPVNHVLHAILTIFTCLLWGIVWVVIAATSKQQRVSLTVDRTGHVAVVQSPV